MVTEPTNSLFQAAVAAFSASVLALLGVSFHTLLWAFFGALVALAFAAPVPRVRAIASVFCGMLCGAGLADLFLALATVVVPQKAAEQMHLGVAFLIGGGSKQLFSAGIAFLVSKINPTQSEAP